MYNSKKVRTFASENLNNAYRNRTEQNRTDQRREKRYLVLVRYHGKRETEGEKSPCAGKAESETPKAPQGGPNLSS